DQAFETRLFSLAQEGLDRVGAGAPATNLDTVYRDTVSGDSVRIGRRRVKPRSGNQPELWLVRSKAFSHRGGSTSSRDLAQWAVSVGGDMQVFSSWTSLSGLRKNGASG